MKKLLLLAAISLGIQLANSQTINHNHEVSNTHSHHHITPAEFKAFVEKSNVGKITDAISREISFFKISDDMKLNLYRQSDQNSINFINDQKAIFAKQLAKDLKNKKITTLDQVKTKYIEWISQLQKDIEKIPMNQPNENENSPLKSREINGPCVNMDFEEGTLNGWELLLGKQPGNAPYGVNGINPVGPGAQHSIMNGGNDPVVAAIPRVNPDGGQYSARLGNGNSSNSDVAILRQTYLVDANNGLFTYSYAVIVEEPGHSLNEQPYFVIRMYDQAGNDIPCGSYSVQSTASNPDFVTAPNSVLYQNWKTAFAPLTGYIGQNVTIEFRVADCSQNGHWGYAYVDASCSPFEIITSTGEPFICDGDPLTLTAPAGANSYLWNTGETTQSITVTTGGLYEVEMIPITGAACSISASIMVSDAPYPVADFNFMPSTVCQGEAINFTDNSTISSGIVEFWRWDFGDGVVTQSANGPITDEDFTSGTYENPTHNFQSSGNVNVTLTITSDAGCANSVTKPVTILPAPNISAGPDLNLCPGDSFTPQGQGGVSYTWDNGLINGTPSVIGNNTTTFTVTGVDAGGCSATDQMTVNVDVVSLPDAGPDQTICTGESVILSGSGAPSYTWDNGVQDGVSFVPTQTTTYTVSYSSPNGCVATDQVTVTLTPLPLIDGGNDVNVCVGQTVVLTATGGASYVWDNGISNGIPFNQDMGTVVYTVTGVGSNGCENTDQVSVTVNDMPSPSFTIANNIGCAPLTPIFTNTTPGNGNTCLWNFGNGLTSSVCNTDVTSVYTTSGCHDVSLTITSQFGCVSTYTESNAVCVLSYPVADFTVTPTIMSSIDPVADFDNNSSNAVSYEWDFGDGSGINTSTNPSHVFEETGAITVMLVATSPDGCKDTTYQTVIINEELIVYVPNAFTPDNDDYNEVFLPIIHSGFDPMTYHLIIFNRWGEVMFESYDHTVGWRGTYGGNIVQDGTYIWRITLKRNGVDKREVFNGHVTIIR